MSVNNFFLILVIFFNSCNQIRKENKFYSFLIDEDNECTYWYSSKDQSILEFCKSDNAYEQYFTDSDLIEFKKLSTGDSYSKGDTWSLKEDTIFFNESHEYFVTIIDVNEKELIIKPNNERYGEKMIYKKVENKLIVINKELIVSPEVTRFEGYK